MNTERYLADHSVSAETPEQVAVFKEHFSQPRMRTFIKIANQRNCSIIFLYEINLQISKELYAWLYCLEVVLRNRIDAEASKYFDNPDWYNDARIYWTDSQKMRLDTARSTATGSNEVASDLSFGFWVNLFSKGCAYLFWEKILKYMFVGYERGDVIEKLQYIKSLRNRIAHYEVIIKNPQGLKMRYEIIKELVEILSPEIFKWQLKINQFDCFYNKLVATN